MIKLFVKNVIVDFVARGENDSEWLVVLVEQLDSEDVKDISGYLHQLQNRLYDCLDAIIDGSLADKFPETLNKIIVIGVDCYNAPKEEVLEFFKVFSSGVLKTPDYSSALKKSAFVADVDFQINFDVT